VQNLVSLFWFFNSDKSFTSGWLQSSVGRNERKGYTPSVLHYWSPVAAIAGMVERNLKGVTHVVVDEIHERGMNEGLH
jgi:hypothetical protein